ETAKIPFESRSLPDLAGVEPARRADRWIPRREVAPVHHRGEDLAHRPPDHLHSCDERQGTCLPRVQVRLARELGLASTRKRMNGIATWHRSTSRPISSFDVTCRLDSFELKRKSFRFKSSATGPSGS